MADLNNEKSGNITARGTDYSQWYLDVIAAADLADSSPVRGCMVIKPNGYAIWENIQKVLDQKFKEKGVKNAYFPLFIPKSFFEKEAEHVEGFAKECAVVTHHRLSLGEDGKLNPAGELAEPLIIRPTSETIIYHMYSNWIQTYRDLPMIMNQWANVVRWEMRTRPFLRTTEFLWQEGHTAHAANEEAEKMTMDMLEVYRQFIEEYLAIPAISGIKTESEKFAGAVYTATIETMMQDGKALQAATSHMLGQNFAKPFDVKFLGADGKQEYVSQTSWGISTRIVGALIMAHSDDTGLVLPPKIAPTQVVIVPVWGKETDKDIPVEAAKKIAKQLQNFSVHVDERDGRPGPKFYEWERAGIPLRIEIGPRDLANNIAIAVRRDTGEKTEISLENIDDEVGKLLNEIQENLFARAGKYQKEMTSKIDSYAEMTEFFQKGNGFAEAHWCESPECEKKIKDDFNATIRCISTDSVAEDGACPVCGKRSNKRVIIARAY
ncbi:MAG: proline--tRNA ligase [Candidatus Berkelbacteria bacterium]|nr:proline--tRNA ligase [Candidatus Berkelbacteria bacterium]